MKTFKYALFVGISLSCIAPKGFAQTIIGPKNVLVIKPKATQGNVDAQLNLGLVYANGDGFSQDYTKAKVYCQQACLNKSQDGCDAYKRLSDE